MEKEFPIPVTVEHAANQAMHEENPLKSQVDLSKPRPLRVCFPILLDGDLVMSPEHLGPAYLVSVLRQVKVECKIIEVPLTENYSDIFASIVEWRPDIIGLSLTTISVKLATKIGTELRKLLGDKVYILAGGPLATHHGAKLLTMDHWQFLDGLVRGEGEVPMLRFAEVWHTQGDLRAVPSLAFREANTIVETPIMAGIKDLDILPDPARDQLEMHNNRLAYVRLSTSRGCTSHCTFCNAPHAKNRVGPAVKGWRGASAKRVVDEVEHIYHKYNVNTYDFVDSTFEDPGGKAKAKKRIADIAEDILARDLKIYYNVCMQAYNWHDEDKPLINLLWRSGLEKVLVGIESGSNIGLKRWQKRSTVEDNIRVIQLLSESNIYVAFGFISFHPWINFEEMRENQAFLYRYMGHNLRRYTVRVELYPGAEVVEELRAEELLLPGYDEELNPFAYKYQDERMALLGSALNGLYGEEYEKDCTIDQEPEVFKFETYDIVLHTYVSRLSRLLHGNETGTEIMATCISEVDQVKQEISQYNYDMITHYSNLAEKDQLNKQEVYDNAETLNLYYKGKIAGLRDIQLKTSMRLYRAGFNIKDIQKSAEKTH